MKQTAWRLLLLVSIVFLCVPLSAQSQDTAATLIVNARIIDGTGASERVASVRLREGRIEAVGDLTPAPGETMVDALGLVLAPGFIDTHSHHDRGLLTHPEALAAVSQGITTIVVGQDGGSPFPLADFFDQLEARPVAVNVASYVGHGTLRRRVLGNAFQREATEGEIKKMQALLRQEMQAGALGLSTGLEYDPGIYSNTDEVLALAREAARAGGRYISHMRSEDRYLWDAVEEIIRIGQEARLPVQISHLKMAMRSLWGEADRLMARLDEARAAGVEITADVYPYTYWQSTLTVLFPERDFDNRESAAFALAELAPPEGLLLAQFDPDSTYVGKTVAEIATLRGTDPVTTYMDLIAESQIWAQETGRSAESVIGTSMHEDDVARLIAWPHTNICTDGALRGRHPRGFGAFPRVLRRYVRDSSVLSLEEAIRKMTSLSAQHIGLTDRGQIRPGLAADLVLFDPDRITDHATPDDPQRPSEGIERVWVNGVDVYTHGEVTDHRPGLVLRRSSSSH